MLYYLFEYLEQAYQLPGATLFRFLTFRAGMAVLLSLILATAYGKRVIQFLRRRQAQVLIEKWEDELLRTAQFKDRRDMEEAADEGDEEEEAL